jgi:iron complex transport system substrate-binding protein
MLLRFLVLLFLAFATPALSQDFPVQIDHAYGSTTIESAPHRVVTWGATSYDAVIALGIVPVGIPRVPYGGDAEGKLPWTVEAVEALGGTFPALLTPGAEVAIEEIAALNPDLIIAVYSGITHEQ